MPRLRTYEEPTLLLYGFRPFFLQGAICGPCDSGLARGLLRRAVVAFGLRSARLAVHEMLYGDLPSVMTGFLFTALPNCTASFLSRASRRS